MRCVAAALCAILITFAAAGCDLEVPAMPMVGDEAGGGGLDVEALQATDADADALPLSIGPVGLLLIAIVLIGGALLAVRLTKSRGRKSR